MPSSLDLDLGVPVHVFSWDDIVQKGLPHEDERGLYTIWKGDEIVYIGQTSNIRRRLGQFFGAALGGYGHPAGWRISHARHRFPLSSLHFQVWTGAGAYRKEGSLIDRFNPALNDRGAWHADRVGRDAAIERVSSVAGLQHLFAVDLSSDDRLTEIEDLLETLVYAAGETPYTADAWAEPGWKGLGKRMGRRWRDTLYMGFGETPVKVWFGAYDLEENAKKPWKQVTTAEPEELRGTLLEWLAEVHEP